jgi:hypothetical protein
MVGVHTAQTKYIKTVVYTPFSLQAAAVTGSINFGEGKDAPSHLIAVLEFLNNLWGRGTEYELGCRTGPPRWRIWFFGTDSWAP